MHESVYIKFHIYVNIELIKILHVHSYFVSETGKTNYVHILQYTRLKNTTTNYVDIKQNVHVSFVDNTFHVYKNKFFSSYSVSYGLVDIALAKLSHSRSVWGSLLHTYPQSLLYLTCRRRIITKCTVLKKDDHCCGNS